MLIQPFDPQIRICVTMPNWNDPLAGQNTNRGLIKPCTRGAKSGVLTIESFSSRPDDFGRSMQPIDFQYPGHRCEFAAYRSASGWTNKLHEALTVLAFGLGHLCSGSPKLFVSVAFSDFNRLGEGKRPRPAVLTTNNCFTRYVEFVTMARADSCLLPTPWWGRF